MNIAISPTVTGLSVHAEGPSDDRVSMVRADMVQAIDLDSDLALLGELVGSAAADEYRHLSFASLKPLIRPRSVKANLGDYDSLGRDSDAGMELAAELAVRELCAVGSATLDVTIRLSFPVGSNNAALVLLASKFGEHLAVDAHEVDPDLPGTEPEAAQIVSAVKRSMDRMARAVGPGGSVELTSPRMPGVKAVIHGKPDVEGQPA